MRRTFNQDAQVRARKGGIGVVDNDHLAVRVQQEQRRLRERLVRLADVARLYKPGEKDSAQHSMHTICCTVRSCSSLGVVNNCKPSPPPPSMELPALR